jgi:uncharacterized protein YegJ (DUF2314 family)
MASRSRALPALIAASLLASWVLVPAGCGPATSYSTVFVPDGDPEMARAIAEAVASISKLDAALEASRARCYVKAAFPCPDGDEEICWVHVEEKRDGAYHGTLDVVPENLPGLSAGSPVRVAVQDAVDWMIVADGAPIEGNFTLRVLLPRMNADEAAQAKRAMGWK